MGPKLSPGSSRSQRELALISIVLLCVAVLLSMGNVLLGVVLAIAPIGLAFAAVRKRPPGQRLWDGVVLALVGSAAVWITWALWWPIVRSARPATPQSQCLSNVKQQVIGMIMYSVDWDDRFPLSDSWNTTGKPYIRAVLKCPVATSRWSYAMNSALSGVRAPEGTESSDLVLLFEGNARLPNASGGREWLVFRHEDRASIGFPDAHVQARTAEQAAALRW